MAHPSIENLRDCQRQLDMDGCEVGVSRQAVDETLAIITQAEAVLTWMEQRASNSRSYGSHADAYEIAARRLRDALASPPQPNTEGAA